MGIKTDDYEGDDRRRPDETLDQIRKAVGRIASHLDSETRHRNYIDEKFHRIDSTVFGNGQKGLVREMDQVKNDIIALRDTVKELVDFKKWIFLTLMAVLGKIGWEFIAWILKKGAA